MTIKDKIYEIEARLTKKNVEDLDGASIMEGEINLKFDSILSPTVSIFRDLDTDNWTTELSLSHQVDLKLANLEIQGSAGNTENSSSQEETYYSVGAEFSRPLTESSTIALDVSRVDSDSINEEYVLGLGVSVNF